MALIARRRAAGAGGDDVLGQLLSAGLDDAELRDHLVTLLAAGHETTAGSLAWALERLAPRAGRAGPRARRRRGVDRRRGQGDPAHPPRAHRRPAQARGAAAGRRPRAARGRARGAVHLPGAPPRGPLPRCPDLAPRALARSCPRPESFAWIPFGGGVRRCLGAAFATMEMAEVLRVVAQRFDLAPVAGARRAHAPARHHAAAGPRRARRAQRRLRGFFVLTVLVVGIA